jgi:hypothetical protein
VDLVALGIDIQAVQADDLCKLIGSSGRTKRNTDQESESESESESAPASPPVDLYVNPNKSHVRKAFEEQTVRKYQELFKNIDLTKVLSQSIVSCL